MNIGTWNVKSLYRSGTAQNLINEVKKYNVDIMALQEVRWTDNGECNIDGYSILYSGRADQRHFEGVGFCLSSTARRSLADLKTYSERIIVITLKCKWFNLSIVNVYAPTEDKEDNEKDLFYSEVQKVIDEVPKHNILMVVGDMNAKVGREINAFGPAIGNESLHETSNNNGTRLVSLALTNGMIIGGTWYPHKDIHKWTWTSPNGRTNNQIDHVLINAKHRNALLDVRSFRGADCDTDHYCTIAKLKAKLKTGGTAKTQKMEHLDTEKLQDKTIKNNFQAQLANRLSVLQTLDDDDKLENLDDQWRELAMAVKDASEVGIGYKPQQKNKQWFDEDCASAVVTRKKVRMLSLQNPNDPDLRQSMIDTRKATKKIIRQKKREFINTELDIIEQDRREGRIRKHYLGINKIKKGYQPRSQMIKDVDGKLLTNPNEVVKRWKEHFEQLLNRPEPPSQLLDDEPIFGPEMEVPEPTIEEVTVAIKFLKNNKSPGSDNIPSEIWKHGGEALHHRMHNLIRTIWQKERIPKDWKDSTIIPIHKKGDKMACRNYRGISLLPSAYKIYTRVLYWRLKEHSEDIIGEYQCGFRPGRSTIDQIFTIRRMMEGHWEFNKSMTSIFIDFKQAYDSIHRPSMWHVMKEFGIPQKIIHLVKACYSDITSSVRCGGRSGESFVINSGLKQGCILSPVLFNLMLEKIMRNITHSPIGITINNERINALAYADDIAVLAEDVQGAEALTASIDEHSRRYGMEISAQKTKIMTLSRNECTYEASCINGMQIDKVAKFKYLGSTITDKNEMDEEIKERLGAGNRCYYSLIDLFKGKRISKTTKLRIYNSIIKPVVTYGCQTWSLTKTQEKKMFVFENMVLRRIVGPVFDPSGGTWRRRHNTEVRETTRQPDIRNYIRCQRLKWAGHVARMEDHRTANKIIHHNVDGRRPVGRPRKDWLRCLKEDVGQFSHPTSDWIGLAADRVQWRGWTRAVMGLEA